MVTPELKELMNTLYLKNALNEIWGDNSFKLYLKDCLKLSCYFFYADQTLLNTDGTWDFNVEPGARGLCREFALDP